MPPLCGPLRLCREVEGNPPPLHFVAPLPHAPAASRLPTTCGAIRCASSLLGLPARLTAPPRSRGAAQRRAREAGRPPCRGTPDFGPDGRAYRPHLAMAPRQSLPRRARAPTGVVPLYILQCPATICSAIIIFL
jgi:hypothetical protein